MSNLPKFGTYAAAFEETLVDDDWTRLEQFFAENSSYKPGDGTEGLGIEGVIQKLRESVNALEKRCDTREIQGQPDVVEDGDTITLKYVIKYTKVGSADYILNGTETIRFVDGLIVEMEDIFEDPEGLFAWQAGL